MLQHRNTSKYTLILHTHYLSPDKVQADYTSQKTHRFLLLNVPQKPQNLSKFTQTQEIKELIPGRSILHRVALNMIVDIFLEFSKTAWNYDKPAVQSLADNGTLQKIKKFHADIQYKCGNMI